MRIGSWWLARHDAEEGEIVLWHIPANQTQGSLARGGRLYLTNQRLLFCPHLVDYVLRGKRWAARLDAIVVIDKQRKDFHPLSGGVVDRLRITGRDGESALFVVWNVDEVINRLRAAIRLG